MEKIMEFNYLNKPRKAYKPKRYSLNLLHRLFDREMGYDRNSELTHTRTPLRHMLSELNLFKCFTPNFTIQNVDKPHGFIRKFTPNGRLLLSFSQDQRSLDVYDFHGVGAIADLLDGEVDECITAADRMRPSLRIRQDAFPRLLTLRCSLRMNYGIRGGYLNREFSVFIEDGRYVLVVSMGSSQELPNVKDVYEYPDLYNECDFFFYNFYLVDLESNFICDVVSYKYDSIQLSHNHGVSVFGPIVAIFSKYRQCIDIYEVEDGTMQKLYTIGARGAHVRAPSEMLAVNETHFLLDTLPITHLKQRILTFLYRRCLKEPDPATRRTKLHEFYRDFPRYERMLIAKMQLYNDNVVLIRYEQHPTSYIAFGPADYPFDISAPSAIKLFVFYRISTERVLNVYDDSSTVLLRLLRDHCDKFRNVHSIQTEYYPSSSCNNVYILSSFNHTVEHLRGAPQNLNPTLPISAQSFTSSHYLDYNLFLYDEKRISALERPRLTTMDPIIFRDRVTERVLFRLFLEATADGSPSSDERINSVNARRELVAFVFHPYEPFFISIQKFSQRYVVNFHIHNKSTIVKQE